MHTCLHVIKLKQLSNSKKKKAIKILNACYRTARAPE